MKNKYKEDDRDKKLGVKLLISYSIFTIFLFGFMIYINLKLSETLTIADFIFFGGIVFFIIAIISAVYKGYDLAKYLMILVPSYVLLAASLSVSSQELLSNTYTYLIVRVVCILQLMTPIIFFGLQQKRKLIISAILLCPTVLLFDYTHQLMGINIHELPYNHNFYIGFVGMFYVLYFIVLLSLLFFQKTNILFGEKLKKQNVEIKQEVEKTKRLNGKLIFQANLYSVLKVVSQDIPLKETFDKILDTLFEIDTISIEKKGLIFLQDEEGVLKLKSHKNVGALKTMCNTVSSGQCLCGKVLLQKETLFCNSVTHDHTTRLEEMEPHGHYILPIKFEETVLGVLCLYIEEGIEKDDDALNYLETVATILATKITKEHQKEELATTTLNLQKSEENFKQISNTIDDTFYLYNITEKEYEYISPNCKKVLGVTQKSFYSGNNFTGFSIHKDDKTLFKEATIKVDNGESYDIEYRIIINGVIRWIREQSFPIKDSIGKTIKNSGICSDITERKLIEKKLVTSEENFKQISDTIVETFYLFNTIEKKYEYISSNCKKVLGVNQQSFYLGTHNEEFLLHKDDEVLLKNALKKVNGGEPYEIEYRLTINGEIRWIRDQAFPIKDSTGKTIKNSGICSDITDDKESEKKINKLLKDLKSREDTLLKITESQDLVFWLSTWETDKIDYISPSYEQLFERTIESVENNSEFWYENIHPEDKGRIKQAYLNEVPKGTYDVEFRLLLKDGRIKWIRERAFPVESVNGIFGMVSGISEDITSKKLMEYELERSHKSTEDLAKISVGITELLSVAEIIKYTYQRIDTLMDVSSFAIGIVDEDKGGLMFPLVIEGDERFENVTYQLKENTLATICIAKNQEILIGNLDTDLEKYTDKPLDVVRGKKSYSVIYLPLKYKEKVIGVLTVQSFEKNIYSKNQVNLLRQLSVFVANVLTNAKLNSTLEQRVEKKTFEVVAQKETIEKNHIKTKLLAQMGLEMSSSLKFDDIFEKLHESINQLVDAEVFGVRIYNRDKNTVEYRYEIESGVKEEMIEVSFSDKDNYTVWCIENNKEILINDNDKEYKKYVTKIVLPSGKKPKSIIFCPLVVGNSVLGALTVQSFKTNAYTEEDMDVLKTLSFYVAIALANAKLYETLELKVAERTLELFKKNTEVIDSINYAKRIQDAILTQNEDRVKWFPNSFVYYNPKEILSGDFYRIDKIKSELVKNIIYFVVGDCTGHGVPGATLTMLFNSIIDRATSDEKVKSPGGTLDYIKEKVEILFENTSSKTIEDGMDVAFCALDTDTNLLSFSGANSNCIIVRDGELIVLKGDRRHVGHQDGEFNFTTHKFKLKKNDSIYLSTDGVVDQFGGVDNRKFMRKRYYQMLLDNNQKSMKEQGVSLRNEVETWQGDNEQTDDICVMGIKI